MKSPPKKKCNKCGKEKFLFDFHRNQRNRDGTSNVCMECARKGRLPSELDIIRKNTATSKVYFDVGKLPEGTREVDKL